MRTQFFDLSTKFVKEVFMIDGSDLFPVVPVLLAMLPEIICYLVFSIKKNAIKVLTSYLITLSARKEYTVSLTIYFKQSGADMLLKSIFKLTALNISASLNERITSELK